MIRIWSRNYKFLNEKKCCFEKSMLDVVKEDFDKTKDVLTYLATHRPNFYDDPNEEKKQVFLLNIFNFLVLYKFA
jgi:hypothetical protein